MPPLWQSPDWEHFQQALGHKTLRIGKGQSKALVVIHPLFLGMGYGYIPRGPIIENGDELADFLNELSHLSTKYRLIFTRADPEKGLPEFIFPKTRETHSVQPETTLILDLSMDEESILNQMKRKGRYNISLAKKKGVKVLMAKDENQRKRYGHIFSELLKETSERDFFSTHDEKYYQTMLKTLKSSEIFIAFYQDRPLAGAICTYQDNKAIYYYGASGNHHRDMMAPYLVQWEAIREGKKRGCQSYDFLGIAPEDALEDHPWKGITEFKKKFGGSAVQYPQPIDIIHRPFWYTIYKYLKFLQSILKR